MQTFDAQRALDQIEGDKEGLELLFATFARVSVTQIEAIRAAIERADAEVLACLAHRFKGSLGLFAAIRAVELVEKIESQARDADFPGATNALANLEVECAQLKNDLAAFLQLNEDCSSDVEF